VPNHPEQKQKIFQHITRQREAFETNKDW
jgi:hypothetical protein